MNADNQQERLRVTEEFKWFLAGVIEGEGSVCISLKQHPTAKYGFYIDPEFFIYQHNWLSCHNNTICAAEKIGVIKVVYRFR